jgi:hypothetical protein
MKNNHSRSTAQDSAGVNGNWWMEMQQRMAQETIMGLNGVGAHAIHAQRVQSPQGWCCRHEKEAPQRKLACRRSKCACMSSACGRWCLTCQCVSLYTLAKKGNSLCVRWAAAAREVRAHAIRTLTLAGLVRKFCAKKAERNKTKLKKIT